MKQSLADAVFKNTFVEQFPGEQVIDLSSRQTPHVLYSRVKPTPVSQPRLLAWSEALAQALALQAPSATAQDPSVAILAGNKVTDSMLPYSACYGGHQFGHWANQLGDGRAITLGELHPSKEKRWELQLKGAGLTPYSRRADGRAVLRSSVREYLMSEAMYFLGVPTTRALSLVSTGDPVVRDMFYDGNPEAEPGAIVCRVAPSFLRFGNFEILAARGETDHLKQLVDWTIDHFYPEIASAGEQRVLDWFQTVCERTAHMIVEWIRVGFVHGVMNTDNMSILGLTIDYGPYSMLDNYDPMFTPNTTDLPGRRYAFAKQAEISFWNLQCLAMAIAPLFANQQGLQLALAQYQTMFLGRYHQMWANKLGLDQVQTAAELQLVQSLGGLMAKLKLDMTIFFQLLIDFAPKPSSETEILVHFTPAMYRSLNAQEQSLLIQTLNQYQNRFQQNKISREQACAMMKQNNPRFILRNYLLHQASQELAKGDSTLFDKIATYLQNPYQNVGDEFFVKRPDWAEQKAGCSQLSCSS